MHGRKNTLLALVAVIGQLGCTATIGRQEYLTRNVAPKAAFDLQCPQNQLEFANLGQPIADFYFTDYLATGARQVHVTGTSEQQGVTGCGKRGRYIYSAMGWVMNTESEGPVQPTTPPQK